MATLSIKSTSLKNRTPRLKVKEMTLTDVVDKLEAVQNNLQLVPDSEEIQAVVVKPAKKKRKVPVDVPGNQSIYWFSNNRKLELSQEQLRIDGHVLIALAGERGIALGLKLQQEGRHTMCVRSYPLFLLEEFYNLTEPRGGNGSF
jgi:hypothetical protein